MEPISARLTDLGNELQQRSDDEQTEDQRAACTALSAMMLSMAADARVLEFRAAMTNATRLPSPPNADVIDLDARRKMHRAADQSRQPVA